MHASVMRFINILNQYYLNRLVVHKASFYNSSVFLNCNSYFQHFRPNEECLLKSSELSHTC